MFIELFIILTLFIIFYSLLKVRSTLKLLIITILLFLTCSALLMLKGFVIISCIFILVYAGAILVMICIAFVLSPIVETQGEKKKKKEEFMYFEVTSEIIQYICFGFITSIFILMWCIKANPLSFWDIIGDVFIISKDVLRSTNYINISQKEELKNYDYYLGILSYYGNSNNYCNVYMKNKYDNNLNYCIDYYLNKKNTYSNEGINLFEETIKRNMFHEKKISNEMLNMTRDGVEGFSNINKLEVFSRYYLEKSEHQKRKYINRNTAVTASGFLFENIFPKERCSIKHMSLFEAILKSSYRERKIIKIKTIPKELLFCNLPEKLIIEITKSIIFVNNNFSSYKNIMLDFTEKYNNIFKTLIEKQVVLESNMTNIKKIIDIENYKNINKEKSKFRFIVFSNDLINNIENLKNNQVVSIFKNSKYIVVLVGLYLHFTLLVCLRIFTINQQLINIKRQDSNDQILKKWKK